MLLESWIKKVALAFLLSLMTLSCSVNVLEEFGDQTADRAILYEAKRALNNADYTSAITYFESLSSDFLAKREVAVLYASAYAGRCGLDFLNFVNAMKAFVDPVMSFLLSVFPTGTATEFGDCVSAQNILRGIGTAGERTNDENTFMSAVNLVAMGKLLGAEADTDDNGTVDPGWNACTVADADTRNFGAALTNLIASLEALGSASVIDAGSIANISTACDSLSGMCDKTDPVDFSTAELKLIKGAMFEGTDQIGVATCAAGTPNIVNCAATCP